jgi:Domain of unknown function (DUF397)
LSEGEQPTLWLKSSFSANGDCLEWVTNADGVRLRQSKDPAGTELHFTISEWQAFLAAVKAGEADPSV